jgi:hypothetical protein
MAAISPRARQLPRHAIISSAEMWRDPKGPSAIRLPEPAARSVLLTQNLANSMRAARICRSISSRSARLNRVLIRSKRPVHSASKIPFIFGGLSASGARCNWPKSMPSQGCKIRASPQWLACASARCALNASLCLFYALSVSHGNRFHLVLSSNTESRHQWTVWITSKGPTFLPAARPKVFSQKARRAGQYFRATAVQLTYSGFLAAKMPVSGPDALARRRRQGSAAEIKNQRHLEQIAQFEGEVSRCNDELSAFVKANCLSNAKWTVCVNELFAHEEEEAIIVDEAHVVRDEENSQADREAKRAWDARTNLKQVR